MKQIWKYTLPGNPKHLENQEVPSGYKVVHATRENIWLELEPDDPRVYISFLIAGTGMFIPDGYTHVHTYHEGPFVWHVYMKES